MADGKKILIELIYPYKDIIENIKVSVTIDILLKDLWA